MTPEQEKTEKKIHQLAVKADRQGIESLKPNEQVAVIVYSSFGIISNGGLPYFYQGPVRLNTLVDALRALGLHAQAEAALSTAALFPDPALANDPKRRVDFLDGFETRMQNRVFFKLSWEDLYDAIANYWKQGNRLTWS